MIYEFVYNKVISLHFISLHFSSKLKSFCNNNDGLCKLFTKFICCIKGFCGSSLWSRMQSIFQSKYTKIALSFFPKSMMYQSSSHE